MYIATCNLRSKHRQKYIFSHLKRKNFFVFVRIVAKKHTILVKLFSTSKIENRIFIFLLVLFPDFEFDSFLDRKKFCKMKTKKDLASCWSIFGNT